MYILTEKGIVDKVFYSIPTDLVKDFDGATLRFKITEEEVKNRFLKDEPNST